jgi:lipopolysaccharide biosynthesis glycosyltransferase
VDTIVSVSEPIMVALAADHSFAKQLAVVIAGIATTATREHQIFVFHDGYEQRLQDQITAIEAPRLTFHWLDARSELFDAAQLPSYLTTATLFRLRIGELLPDSVERVIYIDTDTAIRGPLDELWETELEEQVVAAVRDPVIPWAAAPNALAWSRLGVPADCPYFNAGVLVIATALWRSQRIAERALDLMEERSLRHGDQCALNVILAGAWVQLAPQWNLQAGHLAGDNTLAWVVEPRGALSDAIADPVVVHFNHSDLGRPWELGCTHPYKQLWFDQLELTSWRDWRPTLPEPPSRSQRARVTRRLRRAASTLIKG